MTLESMAARRYPSMCPICARPQVEQSSQRLPPSTADALPFLPRGVHSWWWQGDAGDASTPGGWLRVFGRALTSVADRAAASAKETEDAEFIAKVHHALPPRQEIVRYRHHASHVRPCVHGRVLAQVFTYSAAAAAEAAAAPDAEAAA